METSYNLSNETTINQPVNCQNELAYSHKNSKGIIYYLHKKDVVLGSNKYVRTNYYFAKNVMPEYACGLVPEGKKVEEFNNGLLFLTKN